MNHQPLTLDVLGKYSTEYICMHALMHANKSPRFASSRGSWELKQGLIGKKIFWSHDRLELRREGGRIIRSGSTCSDLTRLGLTPTDRNTDINCGGTMTADSCHNMAWHTMAYHAMTSMTNSGDGDQRTKGCLAKARADSIQEFGALTYLLQ